MIHRRLLADDGRGVEEPLNEVDSDGKGLRQVVRHYVVFGSEYRAVQKWNDQRILPTIVPSETSSFGAPALRAPPISVPETVKLYLRPFEDGSYLLRLHNMNPSQSVLFTLSSTRWTWTDGRQLNIRWQSTSWRATGRRNSSLGARRSQRSKFRWYKPRWLVNSGERKRLQGCCNFREKPSISCLSRWRHSRSPKHDSPRIHTILIQISTLIHSLQL